MSPTYFVVRNAQLNQQLEAARAAGDLPRMKTLLGEMTSLVRALYGQSR